MVFPNQNCFFGGVLNGVVFSNDIRGSVDPQTIPATNGTDHIVVDVNGRGANTEARGFGCATDDVVACLDDCSVVCGNTRTFCCRDEVVFDVKRVLDVARFLVRVGVNGVAFHVNCGIG